MAFTYPKDLLPRLRTVWRDRKAERPQTPSLPGGDRLRHFLEVAFHASLLSEEQRKVRFRLAAISRAAAEEEARAGGVHRKFELVEFSTPRPFSVSEILRLAPATDVTRTLICVQPGGESPGGHFDIWGLLHTGSSWWEFTHGECLIGVPPPNCLTVSSTEPGNLTISHEGDVLLTLKQGEVIAPSGDVLSQGPVARFFQSAQEDICACSPGGTADEGADTQGEDVSFPRHVYNSYLERMLHHIREKRHGGTVLLVPDCLSIAGPELSPHLQVKYPASYDNAWPLLVSSLALRRQYFDLYLPLWTRKSPIPVARYQEIYLVEAEREEIEHRISDSITLLASTSGVDGAVLLTDRLRLLGFGAEVTSPAPELRHVYLARDPWAKATTRVPIDAYGTRHRAAFRFCASLEESLAFVVSQDGGVKAVKRVGDRLILWPDIGFGPLGI